MGGGLAVVSPLRVGPRDPLSHSEGRRVPPRPQDLHREPGQGQRGVASLTTCLRPGRSGRWGPRHVRSAAQPRSHRCRAQGKVNSSPSPTGPRGWCPIPRPVGSTVHSAAEAQEWLNQAHSLRWGRGPGGLGTPSHTLASSLSEQGGLPWLMSLRQVPSGPGS